MDVLTIRERAKRLRAQEGKGAEDIVENVSQEKPVTLTAAEKQIRYLDELRRRNGLLEVAPQACQEEPQEDLPPRKTPQVRRRSRKQKIKQKNIQLRLDQIKSLREYAYRSGTINGNQLNESQICRVALDLFIWSKVRPDNIESEAQLLEVAKNKILNIGNTKI